jgi:hypothetical protein
MLAAGIKSPVPLEELETHLREEIEWRIKSGLSERQAFEIAAQKIGEFEQIKTEFKKLAADNWNRPLAYVAWSMFVISFFVPAYTVEFGWRCAVVSISAITWPDTRQGNWADVHLASLTLANLLMVVSPLLLLRFSESFALIKWLRVLSVAASALTWSFLLILIFHQDGKDLKIGAYVWATSFLLLSLSTLKIRSYKLAYV